jgi:hypothetical protein
VLQQQWQGCRLQQKSLCATCTQEMYSVNERRVSATGLLLLLLLFHCCSLLLLLLLLLSRLPAVGVPRVR